MPIGIELVQMEQETNYAPLAVLGYCLQSAQVLHPIWAEVKLPLKTVDYATEAKLRALVLGVLAGSRSIAHLNSLVRPDQALTRAWGLTPFPEQSALARTLDAFTADHVEQLRRGSQTWWGTYTRLKQHDFRHEWLWLDLDLTPLSASKAAEASTKGKLGKKGAMAANSPVSRHPSTTRPSSRGSIRATAKAPRPTSRYCTTLRRSYASQWSRNSALSSARTLALAVMPTSMRRCRPTGRC